MSYYQNQLTVSDKLFGQTSLVGGQATVIKQTYGFLTLSVLAAMMGGYFGATTPSVVQFFSGWLGWILALVIMNAIPFVAMALRHNPVLGLTALVVDGFVAGLVLAPLLYMATVVSPDIVWSAMLITAIVFFSVTGYVMTSKRVFSAPRGLGVGIFFSLIGVAVLNGFLQLGFLGTLLSIGIGIFGVFVLVFATSDVLNNPEADSPVPGALMLFSGLFNVFVSVLSLLLSFGGDD